MLHSVVPGSLIAARRGKGLPCNGISPCQRHSSHADVIRGPVVARCPVRLSEREKSVKSVMRLIEFFAGRDGSTTLLDRLRQTPLQGLDAEVGRLKRDHGFAEVRAAFIDLLGVAPLEHFPVLRIVFMKHFAH
jgi:hypothetical protein